MKKFDDNKRNTTKNDQLIHFILSYLLSFINCDIYVWLLFWYEEKIRRKDASFKKRQSLLNKMAY